MTSISSTDTVTPRPLPSLPPSPTEEPEPPGPGTAGPSSSTRSAVKRKPSNVSETDVTDGGSSNNSSVENVDTSYPPTNDEEAETRRVEENLRRWEVAERQRRKAARESVSGFPSPPSLVSDVTRRASWLWSSKTSGQPRNHPYRNHSHSVLHSQDSVDVLPLDSVPASPNPNRSASSTPHPHDPFLSPDEQSAVMQPTVSSPISAFKTTISLSADPTRRPTLEADSEGSTSSRLPPPQPLNLPPPRTPPPRLDVPPQSPSPPQVSRNRNDQEAASEERETRWWHDWLCGCSEGPDRGGDNQAGRTNPFE